MSCRTAGVALAAALSLCGWATFVQADQVITQVYPGITHIARTDELPAFQCPGCPRPTPSPRLARMNIVLVDLTAPEVRFKLTPRGKDLPDVLPGSTTPGWPLPPPPFEVVRQTTIAFIESSHAQVAINSHFFAPFPVPAGSTQGAYAYLIGLAASRGDVYSAFESPVQNYAIVTDSPAINIDASNNASVVHRDPAYADGLHVIEPVQLWNALSGSGQIVTDGVTTIPNYKDADHPDELLTPNATYSRGGRHWYLLSNARTAIGLTKDNRTLVLFTVDGTNGGHGMQVSEVADLLRTEYGVWNALNLDGGGSTTIALEDPVTHVRRVINVPADPAPGRSEASSFAVYSDGIDPTTTAAVAPAPNANGWNGSAVTVTLTATDLASGLLDTPAGWVDQLQYSASGAQVIDPQVVAGNTTTFAIGTEGVTDVGFFATDAAGNDEASKSLAVRIDTGVPVIHGMPTACSLWPPNNKMVRVAVVSATDGVSGIASLDVAAASSEPSGGGGADVEIVADGSGGYAVWLRAQRLGSGTGRVYTITATARDLADNLSTATATCVVVHDKGKR